MKLYWSFEYEPAAESFRQAQAADPNFTLAYVGEALTYTHQVWNQQDIAKGRAALAKLGATTTQRLEKARSPRERIYGELAEALYGEGPKAARDTSFTRIAEKLVAANPNDDEAKMFYAVGLLGLNQSVRENVAYMKAGAIAEDVLKRNPDHPAAAHFVIHAYDDPVNAPRGLGAARAYSRIAPAAPHAQHMTTHIFVAMGMWDDVISQNVIAANGQAGNNWHAGHYTSWLGYGYLQAGRIKEAKSHIEMLASHMGATPPGGERNTMMMLLGHYFVDAPADAPPLDVKLDVPRTPSMGTATLAFIGGVRAIRERDSLRAASFEVQLKTAREGVPAAERAGVGVLLQELQAAIASFRGQHDRAIELARAAADAEDAMPYEFGPPQFVKPTHELLGEILLAARKPMEAKAAFERSLARMPGRSISLIGLIRAASAVGDKPAAAAAFTKLKANWHGADADLIERMRQLPGERYNQ